MVGSICLSFACAIRSVSIGLCRCAISVYGHDGASMKALPMCRASPCSTIAAQEQTIIWRDGDEVCIRIARRKNRPNGSGTLRRKCTCCGGAWTCAVHMLWDQYFALLDDGAKPWAQITAGKARERLRRILERLRVPDACKYGTHDFRRGHAEATQCLPCCMRMLLIAW